MENDENQDALTGIGDQILIYGPRKSIIDILANLLTSF